MLLKFNINFVNPFCRSKIGVPSLVYLYNYSFVGKCDTQPDTRMSACYTRKLFLSQRHAEIFILGVPGFSKTTQPFQDF